MNFTPLYRFLSSILSFRDSLFGKKTPGKELLIVRTDHIGDFILFSTTLPYLKKKYPDYRFTLLAHPALKTLIPLFKEIDAYIHLPSGSKIKKIFGYSRIAFKIHDHFAIAMHPAYSRTATGDYLVALSGAPVKITFRGDTSNQSTDTKRQTDAFYTTLVDSEPADKSELKKYADFLGDPSLNLLPKINVPDLAQDIQNKRLEKSYVVVQLGAGVPYKIWPPERMAEIIKRIIQKGYIVVLSGTASEEKLFVEMKLPASDTLLDLLGKTTLPQLASILKSASLYVGMDTGTVHLAAAVGTPTVCIMGAGFPGRFFPYGLLSRNRAIIDSSAPCFNDHFTCALPDLNKKAPCVKSITIEEVWREVDTMLQSVV